MSHLKKLKGKTGIILSAFIVIFVFVFFTLCVKRDSSEGRLLILKISSKMIYEHMLIGAGGFNSYTTTYPLYQMEYFSSENGTEKEVMLADNMQFALNEPIQFICELGIIGGIFIFMIAYKMIEYIKIRKILCTALTVIFFASGFYYILHITIFQNILFILSLIAGIQGKAIMKPASTKTAFIITFLTFIVSLSSTSFSFIKFRTSQKVKYGIERGYGLDDKYCQSIEKFKDNPQFLLSYARQLFNKRNYYGCINVLDDLTLLTIHSDVECLKGKCYLYINSFEEAERCFIKASNICPNRFEYRYELYKLYFEKNQLDKAIEIALSIRNLKEKIPSTYTFAIKLEIERFLNDNCSNCGE
jgi:tetratricopeptide (TPR) repeat protein